MIPVGALIAAAWLAVSLIVAYKFLRAAAPSKEEDHRFRWSPAWDETRTFGDLHYAQIGEE